MIVEHKWSASALVSKTTYHVTLHSSTHQIDDTAEGLACVPLTQLLKHSQFSQMSPQNRAAMWATDGIPLFQRVLLSIPHETEAVASTLA